MADKRQRARVQGAWADHNRTTVRSHQVHRNSSENVAGIHWLPNQQAAADGRFVFQNPTEILISLVKMIKVQCLHTSYLGIKAVSDFGSCRILVWAVRVGSRVTQSTGVDKQVQRKVPEEKTIDKEGFYEISSGPTGVSRLHLKPGFIDPKEADWMFEQLYAEIPWQQKSNIREGRSYQEPRLTAWYGDLPYTYSRTAMKSNPHWHPLLIMLKDHIEKVTGYTFNSLLCNLYRNGKDSIDWHSDDEPSLGQKPIIASLSFGDTRNFEMRKKPPPEDKGSYTYVERIRIPLSHGCLLVMEGETQEEWQHRVPKEYHDRNPRINLTFRTIYPETQRS
ncbi:alpha-ketoglutarate-dependent dioxygenase alkB homolog 3 isoform X3 [Stegostoma tigrinum]|nr:alpha-ketoglutarate-dependent dioxygenase alkB homolog 3 isoform X3 [Stegostoma tigrinum]XP_048401735.1 alpha-ketoglutarate-dependent dioxygenase alkB homolog 3 isoform X3 [Stegostoma tigrinum]XP_048401736.1 alpha-ketoglutarate-dependent dioxygenase alkB homolog 3 isoform X3 [Stegostoma tigrinum]XP_048401737.1 alpha-ketoglutarate-dependent dioxygenase alkB homolog 3 isoform X3 [Stegostoma tigrinum]XP_048401738.1 alpha-ketoglutarate-dependent dioxygenase alkB homolog 3 isoform X3 [Stegostoma 